jgi:hypothetical protein
MNTPSTTTCQLRMKARRLLLDGDLERYLRVLRELHGSAAAGPDARG